MTKARDLASNSTGSKPTLVDAKGDLLVGTAADTAGRLVVGSNGDTLVADSSATTGLRYQEPKAGNPVINSAFQVWQRGTSVTGAGGGAYTADRWFLYAGGQATVSRQATGDTTNLPNIQYCARVQRNNGSTDTSIIPFIQSFETINSIPFAGKTVTLSFYARRGANYSPTGSGLVVTLATGTGTDQNYETTGYTGGTTPISQTATLTTTWQRFSYSATLATNITEITTRFVAVPTGTAGAADFFEITGVQLDVGSVALPFRTQGVTLAGELAACQRYYYRSSPNALYGPHCQGMGESTTTAVVLLNVPTQLRTTAASVDYSALRLSDTAAGTAITNLVLFDGGGLNAVCLRATVASGLTQYRPYFLTNNNNTAGYVAVSAEL